MVLHGNVPRPLAAAPSGPLRGRIRVPGDRSISHRALMLAAVAIGRTSIAGLLEADSVMATLRAVRAFGAAAERAADGTWSIDGLGVGGLLEPDRVLDFGSASTGVRLALGLAAGQPITVTVTGDPALTRRPLGHVLDPLAAMGAEIVARSGGRLPLTLRGAATPFPVTYRVPVPSARVKSAVLLAALGTAGVTTVIERVATRDHTERMLAGFGAAVETARDAEGNHVIRVEGRPTLRGRTLHVPGDPSAAAFPIVAATIVPGSDVVLDDVMMNPARIGLIETLLEMGADIERSDLRDAGGEVYANLRIRHAPLRGVTVPADRAPSMIDEYPLLAVAAAVAEGETRMEGVGEIRLKQSDRLDAVAAGLRINGVHCRAGQDWLVVRGGRLAGGGRVVTHGDPAVAMAFLVLGLAGKAPVLVDDGRAMAASFPTFVALMRDIGADISPPEDDTA